MYKTTALLLLISLPSLAQDIGLETQIGNEMAQRHSDATVWLDAGSQKFAGIFAASIPKTRHGAVILIHGPDTTPDARNLLQPLSQKLPERGWDILAIQAALPESGATLNQYVDLLPTSIARIDSAIQFLENRKATPIILFGLSTGAMTVVRYLEKKTDAKPGAAVILDTPTDPALESTLLGDLEKIKKPLLDIQTNRTKALVLDAALRRKRAQQNNPDYRQSQLLDATSGYEEVQDMLTNRIIGWMQKALPPAEQPPADASPAPPSAPAPATP